MKKLFFRFIFALGILIMLTIAGIYIGACVLFFGATPKTRSAIVRICAAFLFKMKERKFLQDVDDDMLVLEKKRMKKGLAAAINKL
jgi:hypothetical protein